MDMMVMLYMVGNGFDQAACAFVGQAIGAGKVSLARTFYTTFNYVASITIILTIVIFYHFKDDIICIYTDITSV
jgi:Na+-driven multidrug efflux pump